MNGMFAVHALSCCNDNGPGLIKVCEITKVVFFAVYRAARMPAFIFLIPINAFDAACVIFWRELIELIDPMRNVSEVA